MSLPATDITYRPHPPATSEISGHGLRLQPWNEDLIQQMAGWGERGFPYQGFDVGYLRDPARAKTALAWTVEQPRHRHFVATEDGVAVGRISVNLEDENGLYIWSVHVPPEHEGRGVARRMMATLMTWLEIVVPGNDFILTTNTYAEHAHRAYFALGFSIVDTRWVIDDNVGKNLWKVSKDLRKPMMPHVRFAGRQWQVHQHLMVRRNGAPMYVSPTDRPPSR